MGEDEEATLRTLTSYRKLIDGLIQQHRGRFVNSAGDSVVAEFASVVDAVQCAVVIQGTLKAENVTRQPERRMEFRIGVNLGDVWRHSQILGSGLAAGLVPFHKLSQWLAYSLIEPMLAAGIAVTGVDELTGLAEYRNGGLLLDLKLVTPKHDAVLTHAYPPEAEIIVEWRALTVALLDLLAVQVRHHLGVSAEVYPLAKILEGGTWRAGRRIAREKRPDGSPPLRLVSDGTVF